MNKIHIYIYKLIRNLNTFKHISPVESSSSIFSCGILHMGGGGKSQNVQKLYFSQPTIRNKLLDKTW